MKSPPSRTLLALNKLPCSIDTILPAPGQETVIGKGGTLRVRGSQTGSGGCLGNTCTTTTPYHWHYSKHGLLCIVVEGVQPILKKHLVSKFCIAIASSTTYNQLPIGLMKNAVASLLQDKSLSLDTVPAKAALSIAKCFFSWIEFNQKICEAFANKRVSMLDACIVRKRTSSAINRKQM